MLFYLGALEATLLARYGLFAAHNPALRSTSPKQALDVS
jgi:hypothetical protein